MSLFKLSAVDIVKFLKEGKYSCEEVIKSFIEQMDKNEKYLVFGSFYTVEAFLKHIKSQSRLSHNT